MALGRISGPLLKSNLLRDGVDLAFEDDLLYLRVADPDPAAHKVGIKNDNPLYTLDVNGTVHGTNFLTDSLEIDNGGGSWDNTLLSAVSIATGYISIDGQTITTTQGNRNLILDADGGGVVYMAGTKALRIPSGTTADRPIAGEAGYIRFNTETGNLEYWNGTLFVPVGGSGGGAGTADTNGDTRITFETAGNNEDIIRLFLGIAGALPGTTLGDVEVMTLTKDGFTFNIQNITLADFSIDDNVLSTTGTNTDLVLTPSGTGTVVIDSDQAIQIPVGNTTVRPAGDQGQIRFNTSTTQFEGYNGTAWSSLGGVRDVDGNTYIIPELSSGSNENRLYHYTDGFLTAAFDKNYNIFYAPGLRIPTGDNSSRPGSALAGSIRFNTETTQFEGYNGGNWSSLGGVRDVDGNTYIIPELSSGSNENTLYFYTDGNLSLTVDSDNTTILNPGLIIPVGGNDDRPATSLAGMVRFNEDIVQFEGYNGTAWSSLGGVRDVDGNTYIIPELSSGSNENTLYFYTDGNLSATIDSTRLDAVKITTGFISIDGQTISTVSGNKDLILQPDGTGLVTVPNADGLLVSGKIKISGNIIENVTTNEDLIIRANGTGRVIIDGSGTSTGEGNVFLTDPLFTINSGVVGANTYDTGLIFERGSSINKGFIYDESNGEFAAISTIEQGTVKGNVSITDYQNIATASVKLNSETADRVTFLDYNKVVRSIDTGDVAYVDGAIKFTGTAELAIPTGSTVNRPADPFEGSIRYNTSTQIFEGYADQNWQALGVGIGTAPTYQGFVGDGTTYEFTLDEAPASAAGIMVTINGSIQEPGYAYRVTGTTLQFIDEDDNVVAPEDGERIDVRFLSKPNVGSIKEFNYTGDGTTTIYETQELIGSEAEVLVFVNNIYQDTAVYSIADNQVIFDEAPYLDDRITLLHIATVLVSNVATSTYVDNLVNDLQDQINDLTDYVDQQDTAQQSYTDTEIETLTEYVDTQISDLTTYVNTQIASVSNTATDDAIAFAIALG